MCVRVCLFMNVGEKGRGDGVKRRSRGVKGGQRTGQRGRGAGERDGISKEGRMSERIASCGSLYDSTNLLLQYCNNGELLLISLHQTQQERRKKKPRPDSPVYLTLSQSLCRDTKTLTLFISRSLLKINSVERDTFILFS